MVRRNIRAAERGVGALSDTQRAFTVAHRFTDTTWKHAKPLGEFEAWLQSRPAKGGVMGRHHISAKQLRRIVELVMNGEPVSAALRAVTGSTNRGRALLQALPDYLKEATG